MVVAVVMSRGRGPKLWAVVAGCGGRPWFREERAAGRGTSRWRRGERESVDGRVGIDLTGSGATGLEEADPRRIGPVPLIGRLGAGGMGRVYLGVHEGRYVAVKQLLASIVAEDQDFLRRFGQELDNIARLPESATAPLLAGDRTASPPWFATAYVPGLTLNQALGANGGPLPADALWRLLREAASCLADVHALDMVHRDVKPSNVMLTPAGVTLIDFGVARAADQSQVTRTGMVVGTPAYMSPEQASGQRGATGAVDVFAFGSVLAYAASGRPPFGDESGHGVLYRIVHEAPDLDALRAVDPALADTVAACLDKDPEGRPSASELVAAAERHLPPGPVPWPAAVEAPLARRAAFAGRVVDAADLPVPRDAVVEPVVEPVAEPGDGADGTGTGARKRPEERRRRRRVLAVVIPVVVTGATLSFQLLPYAFDGPDKGALPPVSSSPAGGAPDGGAASSGPSSTATPSASRSASASASASAGPDGAGAGEKDGERDGGKGAGGAGSGTPGGVGDGGSAGAGASGGSGGSGGGTAPSGGAASGGSASGGSSPGGRG